MDWTELFNAHSTEIVLVAIAFAWLIRDALRTRVQQSQLVNTDRALELQLQGLYFEMSQDDRRARNRLEQEVSGLKDKISEREVTIARGRAEADRLHEELQARQTKIEQSALQIEALLDRSKLQEESLRIMTLENGELRARVGQLALDVEKLSSRVTELETSLKAEKQRRQDVEAERDQLQHELARVTGELQAANERNGALQVQVMQIEDQLKALKAQMENRE